MVPLTPRDVLELYENLRAVCDWFVDRQRAEHLPRQLTSLVDQLMCDRLIRSAIGRADEKTLNRIGEAAFHLEEHIIDAPNASQLRWMRKRQQKIAAEKAGQHGPDSRPDSRYGVYLPDVPRPTARRKRGKRSKRADQPDLFGLRAG
jgi:hypothetical protein